MRGVVKLIVCAGAIVSLASLILLTIYDPIGLRLYSTLLTTSFIFFMILLIFIKFEESSVSSKEIALIGILSAITAASRIPFAALPNIQPCTFLIAATGIVFGPLAGIMVGSMTAIVSNMFLGQGPWTVWQMVGWGAVGLIAGLIGKRFPNLGVWGLAALGAVFGIFYNTLLDFSSWIWLYGLDTTKFLLVFSMGLPFGILHSIGNVIFALVLGSPVLFAFRRFKKRFRVVFVGNTSVKESIADIKINESGDAVGAK
ncbi:MAG: ECF transporter S component [Methanomassiliicoccales archaeon]|jgi:energy-coupling factor transport system substrate-specific component|nr:ECF transporter S component [Methanomassiliicoccales archaeon]